jgi:hypothetical protein
MAGIRPQRKKGIQQFILQIRKLRNGTVLPDELPNGTNARPTLPLQLRSCSDWEKYLNRKASVSPNTRQGERAIREFADHSPHLQPRAIAHTPFAFGIFSLRQTI